LLSVQSAFVTQPAAGGVNVTLKSGRRAPLAAVDSLDSNRSPSVPVGLNVALQATGVFQAGSAVAASDTSGMKLSAPANGFAYTEREMPMNLSRGPWDMVLDVATPAPQNIGRVVVYARSGPDKGIEYAFWAISGLVAGRNRIVIPREQFFSYVWHGPFTWAAARTLAIKLEANGNGPAEITLRSISAEPRPQGRVPPPVIRNLNVERVAKTTATIRWTTDAPAACTVEYGTTPAYGHERPSDSRSTDHQVDLSGLDPGRDVHVRVRAESGGTTTRSGDVAFTTDPDTPWFPTASTKHFTLGLFTVTKREDLERARGTDFDGFTSYRFSSCDDPPEEGTAYLAAAAAAGKRVLSDSACAPSSAATPRASPRECARWRRTRRCSVGTCTTSPRAPRSIPRRCVRPTAPCIAPIPRTACTSARTSSRRATRTSAGSTSR
jgi:hypothetical protein